MTVGEMVSNGIEFQGSDIRLMVWSNSEERYTFDRNLNDVSVDAPEICELEVRYIFADSQGELVIELEGED